MPVLLCQNSAVAFLSKLWWLWVYVTLRKDPSRLWWLASWPLALVWRVWYAFNCLQWHTWELLAPLFLITYVAVEFPWWHLFKEDTPTIRSHCKGPTVLFNSFQSPVLHTGVFSQSNYRGHAENERLNSILCLRFPLLKPHPVFGYCDNVSDPIVRALANVYSTLSSRYHFWPLPMTTRIADAVPNSRLCATFWW